MMRGENTLRSVGTFAVQNGLRNHKPDVPCTLSNYLVASMY